jgi:acetyl esterase
MNDATPPPFIDPEMAAILAKAPPPVDYATMPIAEARRVFENGHGAWHEPRPPIAEIRDFKIAGPAGPLPLRLFRNDTKPRRPALLYLHGGGWTFGSNETHDRIMRLLAQDSGAVVVGVDYRLAPEHPYPAGLDDALAALDWLTSGGAGEAVDPKRLALGGDSAGANLALAALLRSRAPAIRTAVLFYGCYAPEFDTPSHRRNGGGAFGLTTARMRWYWGNHLGRESTATTGLAAPSRAALEGLPPLYLNAAALDPLLDDTLNFAGRLAAAGIRYRLDVFPGVVHGFLQMNRDLAVARTALAAAGRHLTDHLFP